MKTELNIKRFLKSKSGALPLALIVLLAIFIIVSIPAISLKLSGKNNPAGENDFFSRGTALISKTLGNIFSTIDGNKLPETSLTNGAKITNTHVLSAKTGIAAKNKNVNEKKSSVDVQNKNSVTVPSSPETVQKKILECDFSRNGTPSHQIIFSEINWAGSKNNADDEWLEIKNNSGGEILLEGWRIVSADENIKIIFGSADKILPGAFYLLERTDDNSAPNVPADKIYSGALANSGSWLKIFDSDCTTSDEIDASQKWPAGDATARATMERSVLDFSWHTSASVGGTPKKENSAAFAVKEEYISFAAPGGQTINQTNASDSSGSQNQQRQQNQPAFSGAIITEIMAGIDGNSSYEFVELYNPGSNEIDLTGWVIKKRSSSGAESTLVASSRLEGKKIPPNKHFLAANEAVSSTISDADVYWPKSYTLAYTNNAVAVYNSNGTKTDEAGWTEIPAGSSYERRPLDGTQFIIEPKPNPQNSAK